MLDLPQEGGGGGNERTARPMPGSRPAEIFPIPIKEMLLFTGRGKRGGGNLYLVAKSSVGGGSGGEEEGSRRRSNREK